MRVSCGYWIPLPGHLLLASHDLWPMRFMPAVKLIWQSDGNITRSYLTPTLGKTAAWLGQGAEDAKTDTWAGTHLCPAVCQCQCLCTFPGGHRNLAKDTDTTTERTRTRWEKDTGKHGQGKEQDHGPETNTERMWTCSGDMNKEVDEQIQPGYGVSTDADTNTTDTDWSKERMRSGHGHEQGYDTETTWTRS